MGKKEAVAHHYRRIRRECPHYTATAAYNSARAHIYFMTTTKAQLAASKRRSQAAKKAWKVRKAGR